MNLFKDGNPQGSECKDEPLTWEQEWTYFDVLQNDSPAWRDVVETQTLAMRLKDSLIQNKDRLQGERDIHVSALGKKVNLQFALFAIPHRS